MLVENEIILELKSVTEIAPIHTAQLLTYLKLSELKLGLLLNFNVADMKKGIKRIVCWMDFDINLCITPSVKIWEICGGKQ